MSAMAHSRNEPHPEDVNAKIDDLSRRMDNGFNRVDAKLERQAESMTAEFNRVDAKLADEFTAVRREMGEGFQRMQRLMIQGGGIVVTLFAASRLFG
ncbi:MAG: hypothetical protein WD404_09900 [Solirubrobacterales bacterium]